jgi:hypothetical protein
MSEKPRLVLHIGMHKTGSTSLQWFFVLNRPWLRLCGIDYPKARDAKGRGMAKHNDLFHAISHEKDFQRAHPVFGPSAERVEALARRLQPGRVLLLSAEGFSGESPAFAKAFAPLAERAEVRIVCFLRRQDEWVQSFYKQMVLSREVRESRSFEEFLATKSTRDHLDYLQLLNWWSEAFGEPSIGVTIYPPNNSIPRAFLEAARLPLALRFLPFAGGTRNLSQSSGFIERIRSANQAGLPKPQPDPRDRDEPFFTPEARLAFMKSFEADNETIRARFRPDLKCLFD